MIGNDYYLQDLELFVAPALLVVYVNMEVKNDSLLCLRHAPKFTLLIKKRNLHGSTFEVSRSVRRFVLQIILNNEKR